MSVPSREGSAAAALASPSGPTGREISGLCPCAKSLGGICARVPGAGWRWVKRAPRGQPNHCRGRWVSSSGRNTEACSTPLLPALQTLRITSCYQTPKCCSEACSVVFCPVWGPARFAGAARLGGTPSCCGSAGAAGGGSHGKLAPPRALSQPRSGAKVHDGKIPGGLLTGVLRRAQLRNL